MSAASWLGRSCPGTRSVSGPSGRRGSSGGKPERSGSSASACPPKYGGLPGSGFKYSAVVTEEAQAAGLALGGLRVHTDICMPYVLAYGTDDHGQNAKFELAECATEIQDGQALVDAALEASEAGELTPEDAAAAKLYCTELQSRVVDRCLQLHGAAGYTRGSRIGRAYADARVSRIYGGSSEIMKVIVAKSIGL